MKRRSVCWLGLSILLAAAQVGCGGDSGASRYPKLSKGSALHYQSARLAVQLHHGETVQLDPAASDGGVLGAARGVFSHAFLHVGVYDQFAPTFGEYLYYPPANGSGARGPSDFASNRAAGKFGARADDLYDEVNTAMGKGSFDDFASYSVVLDFWKADGTWYVPWDGQLDRGQGSFGFYRDDMRQAVLDQIKKVAQDHKPRYFIVGSDMERLLGTDGGDPLSETDFSNFVTFFQQAVATIHDVSPQTKVGAGINWDNFYRNVAPRYAQDAGAASADTQDQPTSNAALDTAFEAALLPLAEAGDIVALKSYTDPSTAQVSAYQFLRRLGPLYGLHKPLVWYSIGSPVSSAAGYTQQRIYLESFAKWNAGLDPEMVAWRALLNIDGADLGGGSVGGRCRGLTGDSNDFHLPKTSCFDGLFSSVLQPKPAFDYLAQTVGQ